MTAAIAEVPKTETTAPAPPLDHNSASQNIPLGKIAPSKTNRRAEVDEEFVQSIRQHGVLEPVLVRQVKADVIHVSQGSAIFRPIDIPRSFAVGDLIYEIVCGERRFRAAIEARLSTIPAVVRTLSDAQAMELQIVENDQRENLTAMDRAEAYSRLRAQYLAAHAKDKGYSETMAMQEIAQKVNREVRTVQQIIALGKLSRECQEAMRKGEMEASHGYELCRLPEDEQRYMLLWLRQQTHHSQGDVPSVRRLKDEIRRRQLAAEEQRRQEKLFKDPQPGTSTTKVPTVAEAAMPGVKSIVKEYESSKAHAQTSAPKAPTKAQEKEAVENEKKRRAAEAKKQEAQKLTVEIERQVRLLAVDAIAKKAKLNRPLIDLVAIECLKNGNEEIAQFAERVLGWPKPKAAPRAGYSYSEIEKLAISRIPKLKPAQLAGLLAVSLMADDMFVYSGGVRECKKIDAMAKEHKVNIGKIRKDLVAAAKLKAKSQKPKAGVPS